MDSALRAFTIGAPCTIVRKIISICSRRTSLGCFISTLLLLFLLFSSLRPQYLLHDSATTSPCRSNNDCSRNTSAFYSSFLEQIIGSSTLFDGNSSRNSEELKNMAILVEGSQSKLDYMLYNLFNSVHNGKTTKSHHIRIAALGGSITAGEYVTHGIGNYFNHLLDWLRVGLANIGATVQFVNAAIGATGSEYFAMCLNEYVNLTNVDILLVETAVNDALPAVYMAGYKERGRPLEELVRMVLRQNPFVHIVLVNFPHLNTLFQMKNNGEMTINCNWIDEQEFLQVAKHYRLTSLQWKHVICSNNITLLQNAGIQKLKDIYSTKDGTHPNKFLLRQMGEFLIHYFRKSVQKLRDRYLQKNEIIETQQLRQSIRSEVSSLMNKVEPLFSTTFIDAAECFVSFHRSYKRNSRLNSALVAASVDFNRNNFLPIMRSNDFIDALQIFALEKSGSFVEFHYNRFQVGKPLCKSQGFLPHLGLAYVLCRGCKIGILNITTTFVLSDQTEFVSNFTVHLVLNRFIVKFVDMLDLYFLTNSTKNWFCSKENQPALDSLTVRISQLNANYPLNLFSVVVAYECCKK